MKHAVEIFGTQYASMKKAAEAYGIDYQAFWDRVNRTAGMKQYDVELLVSVPVSNLVGTKLAFVGIDSQARYKVPWSDEYQTARQMIAHYRPDLLDLYNESNPTGEYNPYIAG